MTYDQIIKRFCDKVEERENSTIHTGFTFNGSRYIFDWKLCDPTRGWKQYDTYQDAPYFGTWVNLNELATCCYCEGDIIVKIMKTQQAMKEELDRMAECYGDPPAWCTTINTDTGTVTKYYDTRPTVEGDVNENI